MGNYLNPGNEGFQKTVNSEIYVDKTGMLAYTNKVLNTMQGYLCVSRPRRFGKSIAAAMLAAYYKKRKEYCKSLSEYRGSLLLVGVNYNKKTKEHECMIEAFQKQV